MKIEEILTIEKDRETEDKWSVIHLWKEGGFYRAYDWSAWLVATRCYVPVEGQEDFKPLHISKKKSRENDTFCFIGFPIKSIQKFVPNYKFDPVDDEHIMLTIDLQTEGLQYDSMLNEFTTWKDGIKITEKQKKVEQPILV